MTAEEIYNRIKAYGDSEETTICHLHKPESNKIACCLNPNFKCGNISLTKVIDFDRIKEKYCIGNIKSYSSVDAILHKTQYLLFVEIKGTKQLVRYSKNSEGAIKKFNLNKKLEESILVCKNIIAPNDFINDSNVIYILVIDSAIPKQDARIQFLRNLNTLADFYVVKIANEHLQQSVKRPVRKILAYCQKFDEKIESI